MVLRFPRPTLFLANQTQLGFHPFHGLLRGADIGEALKRLCVAAAPLHSDGVGGVHAGLPLCRRCQGCQGDGSSELFCGNSYLVSYDFIAEIDEGLLQGG